MQCNCENKYLYKKTGKWGCKNKKTFSPISKEFFFDECDNCKLDLERHWEEEEEIERDQAEYVRDTTYNNSHPTRS